MPNLVGLHHVTAISAEPGRTIRFYTEVLGLRLVKLTVNFDDPAAYHLYFGDDEGTPGSLITFFDWSGYINPGRIGSGVIDHLAWRTENLATLQAWKKRLAENHVRDLRSIGNSLLIFADPDGLRHEIRTISNEAGAVKLPLRLERLDHVSALSANPEMTRVFVESVMGLESEDTADHLGQAGKEIRFGDSWMSYTGLRTLDRGFVGTGSVHHVAFAAENEAEQLEWRKLLVESGASVTEVIDRVYFKSIYFREPSGVLFEIATIPPGFTVDEGMSELGSALRLPPWLETSRQKILAALPPIVQ